MNPRTLFSKIAPRALCTGASSKAAYVAILVICAAVMSFGQTAPVLSITVSGPYSFKDTPVVPSYTVTLTNMSQAIASSIVLNHVLSATDGAYLIAAEPSQGTCEQGGQGITTLGCSVGSLDPGASITVILVARMVSGDVTLSSAATGIDGNGTAFAIAPVQRTTLHGAAPVSTPVVSIALSANPIPKDLVGGRPGTLNWALQNSTGVRANNLILAMVVDSRLGITSSAVTGSNSSDPVSCNAPIPGDPGTNIVICKIGYLGGSSGGSGSGSGGSGSSATVTSLQVTVNYISLGVPSQTTVLISGYLSFDGSDSSNPVATGQVRAR